MMTIGYPSLLRYQSSSCPNTKCRRCRVGRAHLRAIFLTHCSTSSPARCSAVSTQKLSSESDETLANSANVPRPRRLTGTIRTYKDTNSEK